MSTAREFLARHQPFEHPYLATVHTAMSTGACVVEPPASAVSGDQLLGLYRHRAAHLLRFKTRHAQELREDTLRFCAQLAASPSAAIEWWVFQTAGGVHYNFAEHSGTKQLLGALKTVSKLGVSAEHWHRLWNE